MAAAQHSSSAASSTYEMVDAALSSELDLLSWFSNSLTPTTSSEYNFGQRLLDLLLDTQARLPLQSTAERDEVILMLQGIATSSSRTQRTYALACALYLLHDDTDNDDDNEAQQQQQKTRSFARHFAIPRSFARAVRGYWLLDHAQLASAMPLLTQADFQLDIQHAYSPLLPNTDGLPLERSRWLLALQAASNVRPSLLSQKSSEENVFLLQSSIVARAYVEGLSVAWREACAVAGEATQQAAAMKACKLALLQFCFDPLPRKEAVNALLSLPLNAEDEELLQGYCTSPAAPASALDVLLVRLINAGQYVQAVRLGDAAAAQPTANEETGSEAATAARRMREARRRMIEGARAVIPAVQRALLDVSYEIDAEEQQTQQQQGEGDLTMSWEQVGTATTTQQQQDAQEKLRPLSASVALRQPPSATSSPRSASHVADPIGALLSAVVRASPTRARRSVASSAAAQSADTTLEGDAVPVAPAPAPQSFMVFLARKRESLGGAAGSPPTPSRNASDSVGPLTPRSGPATPLESKRPYVPLATSTGSTQERALPSSASAPGGSPVTAPAARVSTLTSRSPFAGPPKLPTLLGAASSKARPPSATSGTYAAGGGNSPFAPTQRRYEAAYRRGAASETSVPWGKEAVVEVEIPAAEEDDVEMQGVEQQEEQEEVPRQRRRTTAAAKGKAARRAAEVEASETQSSIPGGFPGAEGKVQSSSSPLPPPSKGAAPTTTERKRTARTVATRARITRSQTAELADVQQAPESSTPVALRTTRSNKRVTRSQSVLSDVGSVPGDATEPQGAGEDTTMGDLHSTPAAVAAVRRGAKSAVRRSTRLSAEPEETPRTTGAGRRGAATRAKRAASPLLELPAEEGDEEAAVAGVRTRSGKSTLPPGAF